MADTLIIAGSSRSDGETMLTVNRLNQVLDAEVIELKNYNIGFYDYEYKNQDDDFISLSKKMLDAQKIIFATPVYWYAMSAPMKSFIDRFSDLVRIRKEEGRQMKDKEMYLLVNGSAPEMPEYFARPFEDTCAYLDMLFCSHHYIHTGPDEELKNKNLESIEQFAEKILEPCSALAANG